jgi:hypothetical protein
MPPERLILAHENADTQPHGEVAQAILILCRRGARWPLLLVDDVTEVVQLVGRQQVAALDDLPVRPAQTDHPPISRVQRVRVEAGLRHVQANELQIPARGASSTQAEIQDQLVDGR